MWMLARDTGGNHRPFAVADNADTTELLAGTRRLDHSIQVVRQLRLGMAREIAGERMMPRLS